MVALITISELRRLSARDMSRLKGTVIIRNGQNAIGYLSPIRSASPKLMAEAARRYQMEKALRTSGTQSIIEEALKGLG